MNLLALTNRHINDSADRDATGPAKWVLHPNRGSIIFHFFIIWLYFTEKLNRFRVFLLRYVNNAAYSDAPGGAVGGFYSNDIGIGKLGLVVYFLKLFILLLKSLFPFMHWYINDSTDRNPLGPAGISVNHVLIVKMAILSIRVLSGRNVNDTTKRDPGGPVTVFIQGVVCVVSLWYVYDASDGNPVCKTIIGGGFPVFVGYPNTLHGNVDDAANGNTCVV